TVFIYSSIILWQLPDDTWLGKTLVTPRVAKVLRSYIIPLGLAQEWKMFAPNPANTTVFVTKQLIYADGAGDYSITDNPPPIIKYPGDLRPATVTVQPTYNGDGYRLTTISKLDWNFTNDVLPAYRDSYLDYVCQIPDSYDRRPLRVKLLASKIVVPTLAEARAGVPNPITHIPAPSVVAEKSCSPSL
ncbi:hypothetical protein HYZ64_00585, partial [Candidatus Berkelbacteria bacterium]|nr:hypothetical protein [Candidatus Berkelbacteria bacterium]